MEVLAAVIMTVHDDCPWIHVQHWYQQVLPDGSSALLLSPEKSWSWDPRSGAYHSLAKPQCTRCISVTSSVRTGEGKTPAPDADLLAGSC
jgi:hypothetical protein